MLLQYTGFLIVTYIVYMFIFVTSTSWLHGSEVVAPLPVPERDEATLMSRWRRMMAEPPYHHSVTVLFCDIFWGKWWDAAFIVK